MASTKRLAPHLMELHPVFRWVEDSCDGHTHLRCKERALAVCCLHVFCGTMNGPLFIFATVSWDAIVHGFNHEHDHRYRCHGHCLPALSCIIVAVVGMVVNTPVLGFAIGINTLFNPLTLGHIP